MHVQKSKNEQMLALGDAMQPAEKSQKPNMTGVYGEILRI